MPTREQVIDKLDCEYQSYGFPASIEDILEHEGDDAIIEVKAIDLYNAIVELRKTPADDIGKNFKVYPVSERIFAFVGKPASGKTFFANKIQNVKQYDIGSVKEFQENLKTVGLTLLVFDTLIFVFNSETVFEECLKRGLLK